jgi:uncharacterized membrane protein
MNNSVNLGRPVFLLQAVRGPILLIMIGVLFAMHQAGFLGFGRTWPLILIVLGVMKLLERLAMPQPPVPPPYPPYTTNPPYQTPGGPRP